MKKNENKVYNQARRARPTERGDMKKKQGQNSDEIRQNESGTNVNNVDFRPKIRYFRPKTTIFVPKIDTDRHSGGGDEKRK